MVRNFGGILILVCLVMNNISDVRNKFSLNFVKKSREVSTSNHMFGTTIWDKLPECIRLDQACDYWLIAPNQETLCIETNIL